MKLLIAPIFLVGILLSGCATNNTHTVITQVQIPSTLLDCDQKHVKLPDPAHMTNLQLLQYITQVNNLLAECQNDVSSIRDWETKINEQLKARNLSTSLPSIKSSR